MDYGDVDGLYLDNPNVKQIMDRRFLHSSYKVPGGESYDEVIERAREYLLCIGTKRHSQVLHISHLGFNRAFLSLLTKTPVAYLKNIDTNNSIVYIYDTVNKNIEWVDTMTKKKGKGILYRNKS
jgi:broad specificity phosphatase PhoE